jgi:hypothetical protein
MRPGPCEHPYKRFAEVSGCPDRLKPFVLLTAILGTSLIYIDGDVAQASRLQAIIAPRLSNFVACAKLVPLPCRDPIPGTAFSLENQAYRPIYSLPRTLPH